MRTKIIKPLHRNRFTTSGFELMKVEYEELKLQRPAAVEDLRKAREMGDLKENGYYKASRSKLNSIDSRLTFLSYNIKTAKIIADSEKGSVGIGSTVTMDTGTRVMTYQFVGDLEADPGSGKLSLLSPIGRAIEGKKEGEEFAFRTPNGFVTYKIKKVE
jgi:transcription elongation factor GreA